MKSLYKYDDYRHFLKDYYEQAKEENPRYSFQQFAKAAGLNSPNYLKIIIDGTRDLTVANIHRFAKALRLTPAETDFFEALVLMNQSSEELEEKYYRARIQKLRSIRVQEQRKVDIRHIGELPYLPAILISCDGLAETEASGYLSKKFGIEERTVKSALNKLLAEDIIDSVNGILTRQSDYFVQFDGLRSSSDIKSFLRRQLELSKEALERRYATDAKIFAHTYSSSIKRVPSAVAKIRELLEELTKDSSDDPHEKTMQLNIQFFPLD